MGAIEDIPEAPPKLTLWRAIVLAGSIMGPIGWVVLIYAGGSFVDSRSAMLITSLKLDTIPARVDRLEERSADRTKILEALAVWRSEQEKLTSRQTAIIEQQQIQLNRQQAIIDMLAQQKH